MKQIVSILFALMLCISMSAKPQRETVIFDVDIHCQGCITKIEKNIAFEQGVKDMECSLEDRTVTIVFDPAKTSIERLIKAFAKINKQATVHNDSAGTGNAEADGNASNEDVDAQSGASTPQ